MYDLSDTIEMELPCTEGTKLCVVRQPTAAEWEERFLSRYTQIRSGRDGQTTKAMNREVSDAALLELIQENKAVKFDPAEAVTIIDQLADCDVTDLERANQRMVITLVTILGEVKHTVKIPSHKDLRYTTEACMKVVGGKYGASTLRIKLSPAAELYDTIAEEVEGYNVKDCKQVPIVHKYKVIDAIQGEINQIQAKSQAKGAGDFPTSLGQPSQA